MWTVWHIQWLCGATQCWHSGTHVPPESWEHVHSSWRLHTSAPCWYVFLCPSTERVSEVCQSTHTECGDGFCQRVEVCVSCPEEEEEEEDEDGGRRRPPCYECPEDCCPLGLGFALGISFAFLGLLVIGIPVGIIVTIFLVSLPEQVYS